MAQGARPFYGPPMRARAGLHAGLTAAVLLAIFAGPAQAVPAGCTQSGTTVTCAYTTVGETALTLPANVGAVTVHAAGAAGGNGALPPGLKPVRCRWPIYGRQGCDAGNDGERRA